MTICSTSTSMASEPKMYQIVEVFRGVVLAPLIVPQLGQWESGHRPSPALFRATGASAGNFVSLKAAHDQASPFSSLPISNLVSLRYIWRGTCRLSGAGLFLNTRPAMSKVEPWQGHRKPPVPVIGQRRLRAGGKFRGRGAAQVGADADGDREYSGLMRARLVHGSTAGVNSAGLRLGIGIGDLAIGLT